MNKVLILVIVVLILIIGVGGLLLVKNNLISFPYLNKTKLPENTTTIMPTINTGNLVQDDKESIARVIKEAIVAKRGPEANSLNVTVSKIEGDYAQGGASASGGGAMWLGSKVGGSWKLVWDGNGVILCSDISSYNFPVSMVPECWDGVNNKNIKR